jgi:ABC-type multidrug transport system ATPase subunit
MPNIENRTEPDDMVAGDGASSLGADAVEGNDNRTVLSAANVAKTYDSPLPFTRSVEVLDDASMDLQAGEIVGIVGENGSGKSTLLQILVGALAPDSGSVERSGTVGWCPQETLLYDRLTVAETFNLFGEAYNMAPERVDERRDELAEQLDFERFLDYRVDHLSGGNRQKVNLAVALLHDPDVLLLDEPYTGFDWETYLAFWDLTESLVESGTAIAIISHLISERERFDRILELRDGRLHEQDEAPQQARSAAHGEATDGAAAPTEG